MTMKEFDYAKAMEELERLASKVEDPSTGLDDIDACIKKSAELITSCREYLRSAKEKLVSLK